MSEFRFQVGPVWAGVVGDDDEQLRVVDKLLCVEDPAQRGSASVSSDLSDGMRHWYDRALHRFPAGLLPRLLMRLERRGHTHAVTWDDDRPADVPPVAADCLCDHDLRDYQLEGVNLGLEQRQGTLAAATNAGKTAIIAALARALMARGHRVLVVVPNQQILHRMRKGLVEALGVRRREVGVIGDGSRDYEGRGLVVATYQSLLRATRRRGQPFDAAMAAWVIRAGAVLVDEAHHAASPAYHAVLGQCHGAWWRLGFTGTSSKESRRTDDTTSERAQDSHLNARLHRWGVEAFLGPVLQRVTNAELIERGISAKPRVVILDDRNAFGPTVVTPSVPKPKGDDAPARRINVYQTVFDRAVIGDERWLRTIARVVRLLIASGRPPVVFSHSVEHLRAIERVCTERGVPFRILHGEHGTEERDRVIAAYQRRRDFGLGVSSILDEGADIREIRAIVLAGARRAVSELLQRIGRAIRAKVIDNTAVVVDFWPRHNEMLTDHARDRVAVFRSEGFDVQVVTDRSRLVEVLA